MLKELRIENLALIDKLDMQLNNELTVLTGETGAGKSIILDGISLIIGQKTDKSLIGKNSDKVLVEAVFDLSNSQKNKLNDMGYEFEDDELIISREFGNDNKVKINGKRYTLSNLKEISSNILDIVGQHDHQYLLNSNYHLSLLDKFISHDIQDLKIEIKNCIDRLNILEDEIKEIEEEKEDILEKKDLYNFILQEINSKELKVDEEEILEEEYNNLFHAGNILDRLSEINNSFYNMDFKTINKNLEKLSEINSEFEEIYERYTNAYNEIDDIANELKSIDRKYEQDPERLSEISSRLDDIKKIKYKYACKNIEELLNYANEILEKLDLLRFSDESLNKKKIERDELLNKYNKLSLELSKIRKEKAKILKENVKEELLELNMPNVIFDISFTKLDRINANGIDAVKFLMSANKGENLKELSKIASGGEISRIMLALKIVFYKVDDISCLIFDEIDTGISGQTVIKIANKLKQLSKNVQIICVTHSPQIAAKASNQYLIYKENSKNSTNTKIKKLSQEERVNEIARILSGDNITEASINIAKEMMK